MFISQILVHSADVENVLRVLSVEVPAREKDDLKEEPIVRKLRKVCLNPALHQSVLSNVIVARQEAPATTAFSRRAWRGACRRRDGSHMIFNQSLQSVILV